jgi:ABC-type branched-subunit amino acid transport system ATPase component
MTVKAIMGEVPRQGSIKFKGYHIAGLPSYRIVRLGLGYLPETRDIVPGLTVRQNLMLGIQFKDTRHPGQWRLKDMLRVFPNLAARADIAARSSAALARSKSMTFTLSSSPWTRNRVPIARLCPRLPEPCR